MNIRTSLVWIGLVVISCSVKERPDEISGVYVREYSFEIVNSDSGAKIGMRTIRDTILILAIEDKFEVSNRKWMKNNYDDEGWKNMEFSDDRQMPTYQATFSATDNTLNAELMASLYFDLEGHLFRKKTLDAPYQKIYDLP